MLPLQTHATSWTPAAEDFKVTLNLALDGCIVPTQSGAARVDYSRLVVFDGFLDEPSRQQLLEFLTEPGWEGDGPPGSKWERSTADAAGKPRTWGLRSSALQELAASQLWAKLEVQTRLSRLYPEAIIAHMPSQQIQVAGDKQQGQQQQQQQVEKVEEQEQPLEQQQQDSDERPAVDCSAFLANAAVWGDAFSWHVDADPASFPPSPWTQQHGTYCNREPGKPLFVSLLLYLDAAWPLEHNGETLFLDSMTDTGVCVRPRPYRAVLFDQDIAHRLSQPSPAAGRPRYSLVMKLVMLPRKSGPAGAASCCIARPEWGPPTYFGSAGQVQRAARQAAAQVGTERGCKRPAAALDNTSPAGAAAAAAGDDQQQQQQQQKQQQQQSNGG